MIKTLQTSEISPLQKARHEYKPKLPKSLKQGIKNLKVVEGETTSAAGDPEDIKAMFPHIFGSKVVTFEPNGTTAGQRTVNVGVILSGGQAPGGHNVIAGIFDALISNPYDE